MNDAIVVRGLTKRYGARTVLRGLDLQVRQGELFALLGMNGAGKTTALECIEGLRRYDAGTITVDGRLGIQLQSASLPEHIRPMEAVRLVAGWNRTEIDETMLEDLGIPALGKKTYAQLSTGQKRRLHLALALLRNPDILVLDEPTAGLDVEARLALHAQIEGLRAQGRTILLASHDMAEVERLCDRLAILSGGKLVFVGTVAELRGTTGKRYRISIRTSAGEEQLETDDIGAALLERLEQYRASGTALLDLQVDHGSLERRFLELAKGEE